MKNELKTIWVMLAMLIILAAVAVVVVHNAKAEALMPEWIMAGDLEKSDAPVDLHVAACLRVDVKSIGKDGPWAILYLPYVPPSIRGVIIFDGWHVMHADFDQTGENALRLHVRADDLAKLDGTVGLYMVVLAEGV